MKNNLAKILSATMIAVMLLGFAAVFQIAHANVIPQPSAYIVVSPAVSSFTSGSMPLYSTFNITVDLINITDIAGIQWELHWNPAYLNCTAMIEEIYHFWTPTAHWSNINYPSGPLTWDNIAGTADYAVDWQQLNGATGALTLGYAPGNVTTLNTPTGEYPTCNLQFEVIQEPTMVEGNLTCPFSFNVVKIGDPSANKLIDTPSHTGNAPIPGTYIISWTAPSALPFYSASSFTATSLNQVFNIYVYVNNLDPGWEAVGFEFSLDYNASLMNFMSVIPGPWILPYGSSGHDTGLLNLTATGTDPANGLPYIEVGEVVLPDTNGTWWPPFPSAPNPNSAPLAIFTFNASMQGVFPTVLTSPLHLWNTQISNWLATPINQTAPVDGIYSITPSITGRSVDVYTGWPAPYGGQGLDQPSDMYWPQKAVSLFANVTYDAYPEQAKDVAFQVISPNGTTWAVLYARTDVNGIAEVDFRLPWPCVDPEQWFGVWTVIGTVDVACTIVNDTVQFHYDYLVEIFSQTATPFSVDHNTYVNVTINYGTYLQQTDAVYVDELSGSTMALSNMTFVVTALDNVQVPFDMEYLVVPFGGAPRSLTNPNPDLDFSNYINSTITLTIFIPKYAVAGTAEIDCAALNNFPYSGGTVESGYYNPTTMTWTPYCPTSIDILAA